MPHMPEMLTNPVLPVKSCHGPTTPLPAEANSGQGKPTASQEQVLRFVQVVQF